MSPGRKVLCVLCNRSEETKVTGALSTKDQVTAHQNCLLFSSGIFCRNSPEFDDLFGFSVEDVMNEVKRGSKLYCNRCKQKGATAGCEVGRCKKSFHYPCAVQERAEITEDPDNGKYGLFCFKHHSQSSKYNGSVNGHGTSKNPSEAGTSKVYCLTCEKTEGNISLESLSNSIIMLYCDKHAPSSYKRNNNDDAAEARPSVCSSDSNSSSSTTHLHSKRRLSFNDRQEENQSKNKSAAKTRRISDSSHSDENEPNTEMEIFAPLESDIDESANSVPENYLLTTPQFIRKDTECQTECTSGNQLKVKNEFENKDEDETTVDSDAESESLLPVEICTEATTSSALSPQTVSTAYPKVILVKAAEEKKREDEGCSPDEHVAGPSAPQQSSTGAPPSPSPGHSKPHSVTGSPQCSSSAISPPPPESTCVSLISSSPCPKGRCFDPELIIDSPSFWKSCNVAGCTQAIFTDFINEMNDIASRIQSDQASQKDYDLALTVMAASGKLAELVAKQQKELQQKQMELTKAAAAMKKVVSALRR
ncbi:PHD finger protein 11 isoform X1 [Seriola lalandi dorsalis]|uniref:PHD finger protein 11 isoform X1 n=1 Tax=Seriola lalandi dorsalis TaxID=1841481 RepID=UPI000C6F673B|nr:PHD finger protein 11 isoform X1 [Seriola lalandi dorsalis]XP_056245239.1 uncharacterized protein phf11 isoform X2 [Seriola aureovittata]